MRIPEKVKGVQQNTADIVNSVTNTIGGSFAEQAPEVYATGQEMYAGVVATEMDAVQSIRAFGQFVTSNKGFMNQFLDTLLNRIALVIITSKSYENPWKFLKRGIVEYGDVIEDIFVNICEPYAYDPEKAEQEVEKRVIPDVKSALYKVNSEVFYKQTLGERELRKAFMSYNGLYDLLTGIIKSMYTSMEIDERLCMKYILAHRMLTGGMYNYVLQSQATLENKITAVKEVSNLLMTPTTKYNQAGVTNFALKEDQFVFVTAKFDAQSGVEVLARAFNLDYVKFSGRYIIVDTFSFTANEIKRLDVLLKDDPNYISLQSEDLTALEKMEMCLVDRDFFMVWDNLIEFNNRNNQEGLYRNNWLHVWKIYASGQFANAIMFTESAQTITNVTVAPATATVPSGVETKLLLSATVEGSDFANTSVTWSIQSGENAEIDATGLLTIHKAASGQIVVKATSVQDPTKTGTATITVGE